jgi:hypothetical protein
MLPTLIVIGAGKCGTTSLYHYLRLHPDVFMSEEKELNFFSDPERWSRGRAWYERQFAGAGDARVIGEASPEYANWPLRQDVPERMASLVPDARLVYIVRDPIDRMVSGYKALRAIGRERLPIDVAFRKRPMYTDIGRYTTQLDRFMEHFSREQLLVLVFDDLRDDAGTVVNRVFDFVGVEGDPKLAGLDEKHNVTDRLARRPRPALRWARQLPGAGAVSSIMPPSLKRLVTVGPIGDDEARLTDEMRQHLRNELRDDVLGLRNYLGSDFHCWGWA